MTATDASKHSRLFELIRQRNLVVERAAETHGQTAPSPEEAHLFQKAAAQSFAP